MAHYRLGAVVYHPKVHQIWNAFSDWFHEQGFELEPVFHDSYEAQVEDLLSGRLDAAWNTNLAYVQTLRQAANGVGALAMRDTDIGWTSKVVTRADAGIATLDDLRGRRVGFGDADSPQAHILPVAALRAEGLDPATDLVASRLDRDLGKHGDTGGAELAQLARLRAGELDACVLSSVTLDAVERLGDGSGLRVVWTSPPFHHCNFTVLDADAERHDAFRTLLMSMDAADPMLCDAMELEYVNRWVDFDPDGYAGLVAALEAGPVVVGD